MKKIMTILAVAAAAVAAQAATITWDSGVITAPNGKQANAKDNIVAASLFLIDGETYAGLDFSSEAGRNAALKTYLGKKADATATSTKTGLANPSTTTEAQGVENSQYAVIIYTFGSGDDAQYKIAKGQDYINALGKQEKLSSELASQTSWFSGSEPGPGPDPVPEPTSLALIALGVAAFGLKRKHA